MLTQFASQVNSFTMSEQSFLVEEVVGAISVGANVATLVLHFNATNRKRLSLVTLKSPRTRVVNHFDGELLQVVEAKFAQIRVVLQFPIVPNISQVVSDESVCFKAENLQMLGYETECIFIAFEVTQKLGEIHIAASTLEPNEELKFIR